MKNIILIGASRSGKSTFTKLLNEKLTNIMIIRTDLLRLAFRDAIYKDKEIPTKVVGKDSNYINYVLSYYKYANMYEIDYIKVVDTVDFRPGDALKFENALVICLGYPNIKEEEVLENIRKYDTDLDWTKNKSDEKLLKYFSIEIENSKKLKEECENYNIKFVDTSKNRNKVLKDLLEYVIKEINN